MAKPFQRVTIEANDDNSFQIEIVPVVKEKKGEDTFMSEHRNTIKVMAKSLDDIGSVIKAAMKPNREGQELKDFFDGDRASSHGSAHGKEERKK